ncbi:Ribokinase [Clavibacter michiganensis]|uniref:Ribokinase n=1 Tax=Clavibacter michiganensis TaxID=28447 RepID=A0A251XRV3_9MICO|nr:Ribokinase [Clavibacter michiganensis]
MGRVVVLGSLNVDQVVRVPRHPQPGETLIGSDPERLWGGKGANQAVAAAAADDGATVAMVGAVGDDADGSAYRARLAGRGIDVAGLVDVAGSTTGLAVIAVADDGENTIIVAPGANARVTGDHLDPLDALGSGDVMLASLELPLDTVAEGVRRAHAAGARVVLNLAPFAQLPDDVLALADPVVVNEHEAGLLRASGTPAPASLLVTLGAEGAMWGDVEVPASHVDRVVDTTGAGDAFCGALAAALAGGADRAAAMGRAADAAAVVVQRQGAQPADG